MPAAQSKRTLVIAGGGIAGLTAAIALCKEGFRGIVLERSPARRLEGARERVDGLGLRHYGRGVERARFERGLRGVRPPQPLLSGHGRRVVVRGEVVRGGLVHRDGDEVVVGE